MRLRLPLVTLATLGAVLPTIALASGYDTPMLYSAHQMGMGGTAIGHVDDPSAIFHNPAGLARIQGGMAMADFSPLMGSVHGSPSGHVVGSTYPGLNIDSETTFAPFFFAGAAYRVHKLLTVGFAAYPVASAGATYKYASEQNKQVGSVEDHTKLVFLDFAPSVAAEIAPGLRIGATYRYSTVEFQRTRTNSLTGATPLDIKLDMKGSNAAGFRVGVQYTTGNCDLGATYRHKTDTKVTTDSGMLEGIAGTDISYNFVLPSKLGIGLTCQATPALRLAVDTEYTWQSQNQTSYMAGTGHPAPSLNVPVSLPNVGNWQDSVTARLGLGYKVGPVELRGGYIIDTAATQRRYPTPFGSPPGATRIGTVGLGYTVSDALDISVAGAYRHGAMTVTDADVKDNNCPFCGKAGDYEMTLFGAYADVRWKFGGPAKSADANVAPAPAPAPTPAP